MKIQLFKILATVGFVVSLLSYPGAVLAEFIPWDPLRYDQVNGPSWLFTYPTPQLMYTVNGGQYEIGFGLVEADGSARGMNGMKFVVDSVNTGHHTSSDLTGSFDVLNNGGRHTFKDVLLMIAVDADILSTDFSLTIANNCGTFDCDGVYNFDNANDFTFYDPDQLDYDTGRPCGYYWATSPTREPISYLSDTAMVTVFAFKDIYLGSGQNATINYEFKNLRTSAVFSIYAYDEDYGYIYHTNRSQLDGNDPSVEVSTFAVIPERPEADFSEDWRVNMVDFAMLSSCWGLPAGTDPNELSYNCDLSGNGIVDIEDLSFFAEEYLQNSAD
jgi:hypothetical protein